MALMTQVGLEFIARDRSRGTIGQFNRGLTTMTRSVLQLAGIGGGLYMLQRTFRETIREASFAQETFAKFDVVFREQSVSARKWAEDFGDSVGRATHDVAGWMAGLQDTFVPLGIARDRAAELSKSLVQLAVDVASFNNKADAEVIRDFTSALVGNHETVRKYGIIISESAIKQEALRQGLNKTYRELTDLEKVQLRYNLIQAGTTDAQGDALRTADSYANQVKRLSANWKEFKVSAGEPAIGVLASIIGKTNEAIEATKKWNETINKSYERTGGRPQIGIFGFTGEQMAEISARARGLPTGGPETMGLLPEVSERESLNQRLQEVIKVKEQEAAVVERTNAQVLADTREKLKSIRAMDYMTRMEKIENLRAYVAAHAADMARVAEAEKLLNDEIVALQKSRLDAMKIYQAELREDMQNTALYTSEKYAEASRSIEGAMSGAFQSMISDGASWRDAMSRFFTDVGNAFARMAADMAARAVMNAWIAPLMSGVAGGIGDMFSGGGTTWNQQKAAMDNPYYYSEMHRGWVPEGVPSFQRGRGLKDNEMAAIIEKDELLVPSNKIVRSGGGGTVVNIETYIERVDATDAASFDAQLYRSRNTIGDLQLMNKKSNHPDRRFEKDF